MKRMDTFSGHGQADICLTPEFPITQIKYRRKRDYSFPIPEGSRQELKLTRLISILQTSKSYGQVSSFAIILLHWGTTRCRVKVVQDVYIY